jgi:hypothetical protein
MRFKRLKRSSPFRKIKKQVIINTLQRKFPFLKLKYFLAIGILSAVAVAGVLYAREKKFGTIKEISYNRREYRFVSGEAYGMQTEVLGKNLLEVKSQEYIEKLKKNPFITEAYIEKRYPNELHVHIEETEPYIYFISPNTLTLFDKKGKVLEQTSLNDNYQVSEVERLIFANETPFKNEKIEAKWWADKKEEIEEEFVEEYKKELEKKLQEEQESSSEDLADQTEGIDKTSEEYKKKLKTFRKEKFKEVDVNKLSGYYNVVRNEIKLTIEERWKKLDEKKSGQILEKKPGIDMIYSLFEYENFYGLEDILEEQKLHTIKAQLDSKYLIKNMLVYNMSAIRLNLFQSKEVVGNDRHVIEVCFNLENSIIEQVVKLNAVLEKLRIEQKDFKRIDLTGEKVIVS